MSTLPDTYLGRIGFLLKNYGSSYLNGAKATVLLAIVGTVVGCLIGFICGIIQTIPIEKNDSALKKTVVRLAKTILGVYVEFFRGTPMMAQAMFIFYGIIQYTSWRINAMTAGFFVISINTGAYMAETMRGGIFSVDSGQTEAAKAIGMTHFQTMRYVVLPQAIRNIMPQIGNNLIINIKDSSVLSIISCTELMFWGRSVTGVYYTTFESFTIVCVMYLIMTLTASRLLRLMEKRIDGADSYDLSTSDTLAHTSGMTSYPGKKEGM
jgi:His/Glu/Gln/Arg/opine family amino acid ABC transporter permease subunit